MKRQISKDCEKKLKCFVIDYRNYEGYKILVEEFGLTAEESNTFMRNLIPFSNPLDIRYDIHSNKYLTLEEWINSKLKRPLWFKRLLMWLVR